MNKDWIIRENSGKKWIIGNETYEKINKQIENGKESISFKLNNGSIKIIQLKDIDGIWKGEENE